MTQKEFTYLAGETRAKAVSIAGQFGFAQDDAEDIAQDVMLRTSEQPIKDDSEKTKMLPKAVREKPKTLNLKTSYEALRAKLWLMTGIGGTATLTEQKAICYTLNKEIYSYPYMLSHRQVSHLTATSSSNTASPPTGSPPATSS